MKRMRRAVPCRRISGQLDHRRHVIRGFLCTTKRPFNAHRAYTFDHVWTSPDLAKRVSAVSIERALRSAEKPSDHVPTVIELS